MSVKEAQRYLAIAEHDGVVLRMLVEGSKGEGTEDTTDWQVALLYYIMCIRVKALGSCRGVELQDHYSIKQWLNAESDLLGIARPYRKAEEWSRDARYEGRRFGRDELKRYLGWFASVYDHLGALLQNEGVPAGTGTDPSSEELPSHVEGGDDEAEVREPHRPKHSTVQQVGDSGRCVGEGSFDNEPGGGFE